MKVLHIQKATGLAGSERHLLALLSGLKERGIDVTMCVLAAGDYRRFTSALDERSIPTVVVPSGRDVNPKLSGRLAGVMREVGPDLVHTHLVHADLYGGIAAKRVGVPRIRSVHAAHPSLRKQPSLALHRFAARNTRLTIAISHHVARFVGELKLALPDDVRVVHYGLDASRWEPDPHRWAARRASFGIEPAEVAVGIASRLFPNKGHDFAIASFERAVAQEQSLRLLIAGDGPLRAELEASTDHPAVRFLGFVDDIGAFMSACDVMVFPTMPSFGEGFGLAALEGMASGRCVVATDLDSLPELIEPGHSGLLVEPGDRESLAEILVNLARDPAARDRLGEAARRRVIEEFTVERMIDGTIRVYEEVS